MWVLIIALMSGSSSSGQAITSVPGFTTEQSCKLAANEFNNNFRKINSFTSTITICSKQ